VGADLVVRTGSLLAALTLATALAARMGGVALGSWQITMQIFLLLSLTMDALAIAAQALVAKHLGFDDGAGARRIARRLMELGVVAGVVLGTVLYALRLPLASIFTDDPRVLERAGFLIGLLAISQPVAAAAFMLDGILIGALMTRFLAGAMVISSALFAVVALVVFEQGWGTTGLAIGIGLWLTARVVTTGRLYLSARWTATALPPRTGAVIR
jgi:Na+-driven multidrug efflux pump